MKRYSILWWWLVLPTSVVVGVPAFLVAGEFTSLRFPGRIAVAVVVTFAADFAIAALMESVAPTRLNIGPGEKILKSDIPAAERFPFVARAGLQPGWPVIPGCCPKECSSAWSIVKASN